VESPPGVAVGEIGSNNSLSWFAAGAAGIVTSGGVRDRDECVVQQVPIFCRTRAQSMVQGRIEFDAAQVPINIGGALVRPGDIVVADGDGVIVVPIEHAETVAKYARQELDNDKVGRRRIYEKLGWELDDTVAEAFGARDGTCRPCGAGNLGMPMARRLIDRGWPLLAFDVLSDRAAECARHGAVVADSVDDIADCDIVALVVPDDAAVSALLDDGSLLDRLPAGRLVVVHSTVLPATAERLGDRASGRGLHFVDGPVSVVPNERARVH